MRSKTCDIAYQKALDYLYTSLPNYHHQGVKAIKKMGLDKIKKLCQELGNPEKSFKSIHIAGTNGKGSTSHALTAILGAAGYTTGLYTSPHIKDFRERIRINGKVIDQDYVVNFVDKHQGLFENTQASFFEISVALAFTFFAEKKVDIAVIEVGLGGRLDATNVIIPEIAIITHIGLDHTSILGNSLAQIAYEKAGIIKINRPVVIGEYQRETMPVFKQMAITKNAQLIDASSCYQVELIHNNNEHLVVNIKKGEKIELKSLIFDGGGVYQCKNIPGILKAIDVLNKRGFIIQKSAIRSGLSMIKQCTGLLGRWQMLSKKPMIIADIAHNQTAFRQVIQQLRTLSYNRIHIVFGMVKKPIEEVLAILALLPLDAMYYFVQAHVPRAMNIKQLAELAGRLNLQGAVYKNVYEGLSQAQKNASHYQNDIILITGSTYIVGEALQKS